jgi:hypothetical protein
MGISSLEFSFLNLAYQRGCLSRGGALLEFGEGETINLDVASALNHMLPEGEPRDNLLRQAEELKTLGGTQQRYGEAKLMYRALFDYKSYAAIDLAPGADYCIQQDLNQPFVAAKRYDVCINNGTSEHIFNQANFYQAMHDHTRQGGSMIHWTPCMGYYDHGFFNVQPGFFHDLARDNDYELLLGSLVTKQKMFELVPHAVNEAMLKANPDLTEALACVVMKKLGDAPFRFPLQRAFRPLKQYQSDH